MFDYVTVRCTYIVMDTEEWLSSCPTPEILGRCLEPAHCHFQSTAALCSTWLNRAAAAGTAASSGCTWMRVAW